jgi:hypothetical protein
MRGWESPEPDTIPIRVDPGGSGWIRVEEGDSVAKLGQGG